MPKLLIIYPHWPPSNLVGVHRPRLIANNLLAVNWKVTILSVEEGYYEENLDPHILKMVKRAHL